jgi:AraC-like DNA-binding protein
MLAKVEPNTQYYLEQAGLPENILTSKHQYMPEIPVRNLLEIIQQKSGETQFQEILWQSCQTLFIPHILYRIKNATNVLEALECFLQVRIEDAPHSQITLQKERGEVWLGRQKAPSKESWFTLLEQFMLVYMIELIRALSRNKQWLPTKISIQSDQVSRYQQLLALQPNSAHIQLISERDHSAIAIPDAILVLPYYPKLHWQAGEKAIIARPNFFDSLKTALPAYLCAGKLPISKAAQIAGMSIRTLQRNLKAAGTSYRELLAEVQINQAKLLLQDSENSVTAVANHLGYSNISHFSRAFKKATGIPPSQYVKNRLLIS